MAVASATGKKPTELIQHHVFYPKVQRFRSDEHSAGDIHRVAGPRCRAALRRTVATLLKFDFERHTELIAWIFLVACSCYERLFTVVSHLEQSFTGDGVLPF